MEEANQRRTFNENKYGAEFQYDPEDRQTYMHNRDMLQETDEERLKKRQDRKDLILSEIQPFFEQHNDKVKPEEFVRYLDSKCSDKKYNAEVVKTIFDRMELRNDGTVDADDFVEQFLNIEDILKKHHLEILHQA